MRHFRIYASSLALAASLLAAPAWAGTVITKVEGEPTIDNSGVQRQAAVGMPVEAGEMVVTGPGCRVDFAINDAVGCRLLEGTTCMIAAANGGMKVSLSEGNVVLNLKKLPAGSTFELETPLAIASVRGTQFWGRVPKPGTPTQTTFAVREGTVELNVKAVGKAFTLNAGDALDVPDGAAAELPAVRPALAGELDAMAQASDIATSG